MTFTEYVGAITELLSDDIIVDHNEKPYLLKHLQEVWRMSRMAGNGQ